MSKTRIEWTDYSWNPVTGCDRVSAGCDHCYAKRMATRLQGRYGYPQDDPFKVTLHPDRLDQPLHWRKPRMIFVCSMGDLFHKDVAISTLNRIFNTFNRCYLHELGHKFIILTKRPARMARYIAEHIHCETSQCEAKTSNIWLGVSVEDQPTADLRIGELLKVPAAVIVVSYEPALGSLILPPGFLKRGKRAWCIVGGETGPGARPMNPEWARSVKTQCVEAGVPFFFKQRGPWIPDPLADPAEPYVRTVDGLRMSQTSWKRQPIVAAIASRLLDGKEWNEIPERR